MYNAQVLKDRIRLTCKEQNTSVMFMLSECGLGVNAISQISDTKGMSCIALFKIADFLDVSIDYLLGRTDKQEVNK